ncbi:hypothetical protein GGU11DRAFT_663972, partial [Lentinula aff. detonsa]
TSTKLGDDFLCVPKLDVSGKNWVIYKDRLRWSIDARGLLKHVDGTTPTIETSVTATDGTRSVSNADEVLEWKKGEAIVKQQIAGTIPDSLFIKHRSKGSAKELFNALAAEFKRKSRMVSVDL